MPQKGTFNKIKKEIHEFLRQYEIDKEITFRLENTGRQPYTEPIFSDNSYLIFESIRHIIIHYRPESLRTPFEFYHEAGHIILGKRVHIWLLMYSVIKDQISAKYRDRFMMTLNLLDLPVDDLLFQYK